MNVYASSISDILFFWNNGMFADKKINKLLWEEKAKHIIELGTNWREQTDVDVKFQKTDCSYKIQLLLAFHVHLCLCAISADVLNLWLKKIFSLFCIFGVFFMNLLLYCYVFISVWTSLRGTKE